MADTSNQAAMERLIEELKAFPDAVKQFDTSVQEFSASLFNASLASSIVLVMLLLAVASIFYWYFYMYPKWQNKLREDLESHRNQLKIVLQQEKAILDQTQALFNSLQASGIAIDTDLRDKRAEEYKKLWHCTRDLPAWPRAPSVAYQKLAELSGQLRDWYFGGGGMYISTAAMAAYRRAQVALSTFETEQLQASITDQEYSEVRAYLSTLRSKLTDDLLSRQEPFAAQKLAAEAAGNGGHQIAQLELREVDEQTRLVLQDGSLAQLIGANWLCWRSEDAGKEPKWCTPKKHEAFIERKKAIVRANAIKGLLPSPQGHAQGRWLKATDIANCVNRGKGSDWPDDLRISSIDVRAVWNEVNRARASGG